MTETKCGHDHFNARTIASYNGENMCTLIDTGAQISLIGNETWELAKKGNEKIIRSHSKLIGIAGE